jgi:tetraacyldisaccharide 4'-kinase
MQSPCRRNDAGQCLHLVLRLSWLRRDAAAEGRRLLRVLLLWQRAVSADAASPGLLRADIVMPDRRALQDIWYGGRPASFWLRALASVYGAVVRGRRALYDIGFMPRVRLPVPVIVVGNITAGGTGKTPLTIALVEALRARGWKPGVVSRGYGGDARRPQRVDAGSDPAIAGDEPCLIARATAAPLVVGRDRVAAARLLLESATVDVLIADDGLQHYRLCRDIEICVIDGERRYGNGRLLPAGPLREPIGRAATFAFRVCNGGAAQDGEIPMTLSGDEAVSLATTPVRRKLGEFSGQRLHAVAGIGNPARFFDQLRAAGMDVVEHPFVDHRAFVASDIEFDDDLPVLMTEKDAVKCVVFAGPSCWYVPVRAALPQAFFDAIDARLRRPTA